MAVTVDDLKAYVNAGASAVDLLTSCLADATVMVDGYTVDAQGVPVGVPSGVKDRCYLIVAADLYARRNAPNGIVAQQFATADGAAATAARVARDPLAGAYPLLNRYVSPW